MSVYLKAAIRDPCGALVLFNYPKFFRSVTPTTNAGIPVTNSPVDLAALDVYRDRSRGEKRHYCNSPPPLWEIYIF